MNSDLVKEVTEYLKKDCWYVSCGGAAGSSFQLALGKPIPRDVVLRNTAHSEQFRNFEGEANLLVWCTWRLDGVSHPITGSDDSSEKIELELQQLVGKRVVAAEAQLPGWDLKLEFDGCLILNIFSDHLGSEPSMESNWELHCSGESVIVGAGSQVSVSRHELP